MHLFNFEKKPQFSRSFLEIFQREDFFSLLITDVARFHLNGFADKRKFRYWGVENLRILNEKELHHNA